MTHYRRNTTPGKTPTKKELGLYLARIASLGQIERYKFPGGRFVFPPFLVAGVAFVAIATVIAVVYYA